MRKGGGAGGGQVCSGVVRGMGKKGDLEEGKGIKYTDGEVDVREAEEG